MEKSIIVLTGAPGSGKGYLCDCLIKALEEKLGCEIAVISTGDLIRKEIKNDTQLGQEIKDIMEAGKLVSDEIIAQLVKKNIDESTADILIFDGYPRTKQQAKDFREIIKGCTANMIHRETPRSLILERVKNRRICTACGKVQTAAEKDCIVCHGELGIRKDDAVIEQRLKVFDEETLPALLLLSDCCQHRHFLDGTEDAKQSVAALIDELIPLL